MNSKKEQNKKNTYVSFELFKATKRVNWNGKRRYSF